MDKDIGEYLWIVGDQNPTNMTKIVSNETKFIYINYRYKFNYNHKRRNEEYIYCKGT